MNKQRYLAELQRLLVFMTEEDREITVHRYGALFDEAGEAGEAELIAHLGSPTKAAIQLSRGYEPGQVEAVLPAVKKAEPEPVEAPAPQPEEPAPWDGLPQFELPSLDEDPLTILQELEEQRAAQSAPEAPQEPEAEAEAAPAPETEAAPEAESASAAEPEEPIEAEQAPATPDEPKPEPETAAEAEAEAEAPAQDEPEPEQTPPAYPEYPERTEDEPWRRTKPAPEPKDSDRPLPLGVGIPLFVLVMVALGLPLLALCLGVMALLLIPGGLGIFGAYLAAVGGLWCLSYIADAILMFGLAFLILALGLIVLWLGLWADVKLAGLYVQGVNWLSGELLGRKVTEDE